MSGAKRKLLSWLLFSLLVLLPFIEVMAAGAHVVWVQVEGTVDLGLAPYIKRVVTEAERDGARAVILEINTLGGRVDAAIQIRDTLLAAKVPTVAFINHRAISAGALISLACEKIAIADGSTIGAATPIEVGADQVAKPVEEKMVSYFRNEFKATAERRGRPTKIAEAMVDRDAEIPGLNPKGKLLTLTTEDALREKVADYRAQELSQLLRQLNLGGAEVRRADLNWAEVAVRGITHPVVSGILLTLGILGLVFAFKTGEFGILGTISLTLLALFFFGHSLVKLAGLEELLLFALGIGFLVVELFIHPTLGVVALLGILCCLAAIFLSMIAKPIGIYPEDIASALWRLLIALASSGLAIILLAIFFPRSRFSRRVTLTADLPRRSGVVAADLALEQLLGKTGRALSLLRPSGRALIEGQTLSVVTRGELLEAGTPLEVVAVEGNRIVVRAKAPNPS